MPQKQNINNNIINSITKHNIINNNENIFNVEKDYSYKTYASNNYTSHSGYDENNLYKEHYNITFNHTNDIHKHINQYSTDAFLITIR